jgi:hypothetical protein
MVDIREHGGPYGGGKYGLNSKVFLENTDMTAPLIRSKHYLGYGYGSHTVYPDSKNDCAIIYYATGSAMKLRKIAGNGTTIYDKTITSTTSSYGSICLLEHSNGNIYLILRLTLKMKLGH